MSIFALHNEGQESEPRVLKAQLTLAATAARITRITSPVWALACAFSVPPASFGHVSFAHTETVLAAGGSRRDGRERPDGDATYQ